MSNPVIDVALQQHRQAGFGSRLAQSMKTKRNTRAKIQVTPSRAWVIETRLAVRRSLAGIHTFVVRTAVYAGMYTLPSRATFLASIGESGECPFQAGANNRTDQSGKFKPRCEEQ